MGPQGPLDKEKPVLKVEFNASSAQMEELGFVQLKKIAFASVDSAHL